jgi:hypothetical protein
MDGQARLLPFTKEPSGRSTPSSRGTRDELNEIAAMIARLLSHYWTAADPVETRQAQHEDWLIDLREFGPEIVEQACTRWRRQPDGRRPTPGQIREFCIEEQNGRRNAQAVTDQRNERWPKWLEDIWGPEPDGPLKRAENLRRRRGIGPGANGL